MRDKRSTRNSDFGVFTQPGSKADLTARKSDFPFNPESGLKSDGYGAGSDFRGMWPISMAQGNAERHHP
jgi:hypothetical protein